eukprot:1715359-Amphidinium_carterae.1
MAIRGAGTAIHALIPNRRVLEAAKHCPIVKSLRLEPAHHAQLHHPCSCHLLHYMPRCLAPSQERSIILRVAPRRRACLDIAVPSGRPEIDKTTLKGRLSHNSIALSSTLGSMYSSPNCRTS